MNLTKVTVTGADDSVDPVKLIELGRKYPFAEFGILMSSKNAGSQRYPSTPWVWSLAETVAEFIPNNSFSSHICGGWVRDIMVGKWSILDRHGVYMDIFDRIQLNFHSTAHLINEKAFIKGLYNECLAGTQFIFQHDGVNNRFLTIAERAGFNAVPLFDRSGGLGILPDVWPSADPFDHGAGYAGGLSPDNVADELRKIEKVCGDKEIWIDAETHLRSNNDQQFDLAKVEAFLKAAEPFVKK